ncbi:hypothetical protein D9M68_159160 [compost metagenome]
MSKKIKKALNVATFGLSGAAERLALDPFKAAAGAAGMAGPDTTNMATGSTAAPDVTPTAQDPDALAAREAQRRRQLAAAGLSSNIITGAQGLQGGAYTNMKSLLGS